MPIFEFKCPACGLTMETVCSFDESQRADFMPCSCGPDIYMTKLISKNTSVIYNCDGFHCTDYSKEG